MLPTISYRIITGIVALCNWLGLVRWQVSGVDNLPARTSGMILVCNHLEWHDIPLIGWGLPVAYQPWWFAKHDLRDGWWYGWWVKRMPIIPVRRGQRDRNAVHHAIADLPAVAEVLRLPDRQDARVGALLDELDGKLIKFLEVVRGVDSNTLATH